MSHLTWMLGAKLGPLKEQQMLLTTEPSLLPSYCSALWFLFITGGFSLSTGLRAEVNSSLSLGTASVEAGPPSWEEVSLKQSSASGNGSEVATVTSGRSWCPVLCGSLAWRR